MNEFLMKKWWHSFNEELYRAYLEAKFEREISKKNLEYKVKN